MTFPSLSSTVKTSFSKLLNSGNLKYFDMWDGIIISDMITLSGFLSFLSSHSFTILIVFQLGFFILLPLTTSSSVKSLNFKNFQVFFCSFWRDKGFSVFLRWKVMFRIIPFLHKKIIGVSLGSPPYCGISTQHDPASTASPLFWFLLGWPGSHP